MKNKQELKKQIIKALTELDANNFNKSYDKLLDIILMFKQNGLKKQTAIKSLSEVDSEIDMNDYQEDVFLEVCSRVEGLSSDNRNINWKE